MAYDDTTTTTGGALMPRSTLGQLVAAKEAALDRLGDVWAALEAANDLARVAAPSGLSDWPFLATGSRFNNPQTFDTRAKFEAFARRSLDRSVWSHVIRATQLDELMDKQERESFRAALDGEPLPDDPAEIKEGVIYMPPATVEHIAATVERLIGDSDLIFKRGIANVFAKLDRRFRSHDGFKIGARIVLESALSDFGSWNHYRHHDDSIIDVERAFHQLEDKRDAEGKRIPPPGRDGGIVGLINSRRRGYGKQSAFEVENELFRAKVFGNGNIHLWFKRADLVARVNQLLADYYGATLGASPDVADQKRGPSGAVAKNMGWFPTPEAVAARVISEAKVHTPQTYSGTYPRLRVLEPSAGLGALSRPCVAAGHDVVSVELHPERAADLRASGAGGRVVQGDFLAMTPAQLGTFDRIVMNPPFDRGLDVEHVTHALQFLKPGGVLCAVMAAGVEFREDRRTTEFRALVQRLDARQYVGGCFRDLPAGAFSEVGTNVNTVMCTVQLRGEA